MQTKTGVPFKNHPCRVCLCLAKCKHTGIDTLMKKCCLLNDYLYGVYGCTERYTHTLKLIYRPKAK